MDVPSGPVENSDIAAAIGWAWWSLTGRPVAGGGFPIGEHEASLLAAEAIEEMAEHARPVRLIAVPGGTSVGISQYTLPVQAISVVFAMVGERLVPSVTMRQLEAAAAKLDEAVGTPRVCHYDREINRLLLFPAPSTEEPLAVCAEVLYTAGGRLPWHSLPYVTLRVIERARQIRESLAVDVAQLAGSLAQEWKRVIA